MKYNQTAPADDGISELNYSNTSPLLRFTKYVSRAKSKNSSKFDPFKSPPDFQMAIQHGIAHRVCYFDGLIRKNSDEIDSIVIEDDQSQPRLLSQTQPCLQEKQCNPDDPENKERAKTSQSLLSPSELMSINDKKPQDENRAQSNIKDSYCPCCGMNIQNTQLPIQVNLQELVHLGGID